MTIYILIRLTIIFDFTDLQSVQPDAIVKIEYL